MRRINQAELRRIVADYRRRLDLVNGNFEKAMLTLNNMLDRGIIREVLRVEGVIDQRAVVQAQTTFQQLLQANVRDFTQVVRDTIPEIFDATLAKSTAVARLTMSGPTLARTLSTYRRLAEQASRGVLLQTAEHTLGIWGGEFYAERMKTMLAVQKRVFAASVQGTSSSALAKSLVGDLGALNLQDRINPEAFARQFARTKINELNNAIGQEIGHEAGMELYINVGVPDDRQSTICYEASQQDAQTLEWWDASIYGRPPRHYGNCRCDLLAVPEKIKWKMPNPKYEEQEVGA